MSQMVLILMPFSSDPLFPLSKIMVIDGTTVITGSFNFTKAAEENNAENLLVLHDRALADKYEQNFQKHLAHSERYTGR